MKKRILLFAILLVTAVSAIVLTGCSRREETGSGSVSFVLSPRDYFPQVSLETIGGDYIYNAVDHYQSVSAVVDDGKPYLGADFNITEPTTSLSSSKQKEQTEEYTAQIQKELLKLKAKTAESDWLSAVKMSADVLHSKDGEVKAMVIFDNFLSTTGLINYAENQNLLKIDQEEVIAKLKEKHALPDLSDIDVVVYGLGQTCGSQPEIDSQSKSNLETFVKAVLTESNAKSVTIKTDVLGTQSCKCDVHCSIIPFTVDCLNMGSNLPDITIFSEEAGVKFQANTCAFVDESAAAEAMASAAAVLKENPDLKVILLGMTELTDDRSLSEQRANTCRNILMQLGVGEGQISCVGTGNADNILRSENAAENRAVYMINASSEFAKTITDLL